MRTASDLISQALWPLLATAGAILILALLVAWIRSRWHGRDDPAATSGDLLTEYREMHERGELSDEEFRRIKSRMASRMVERSAAAHVGSAAPRVAGGEPGRPSAQFAPAAGTEPAAGPAPATESIQPAPAPAQPPANDH